MDQKAKATKRPVNFPLSEDNVPQDKARRAAHDAALRKAVATWSTFAEEHGSFADEHFAL